MNLESAAFFVFLTFPNVLTDDVCKRRWKERSCQETFEGKCYTSVGDVQSIKTSEETLIIECNYETPFDDAVKCSYTNRIISLTMIDCIFSDFTMNTFLDGKTPVVVTIEYTKHNLIKLDLNFVGMHSVIVLSILKVRAGIAFSAQFGEGSNSIDTLNIDGHSFKEFRRNLRPLKKLRVLKIRHGPLSVLEREMFSGFRNVLVTLDLSWNRIRSIEVDAFKSLEKLRTLYLTGNLITNIKADYVSDLVDLKYLKLDMNKLANIPIRVFKPLAQLLLLDISGNLGIQNLAKGFFDGVKALRYFFASNCSLSNIEETFVVTDNVFFQRDSQNNKTGLLVNTERPSVPIDESNFISDKLRDIEILELNISLNKLTSISRTALKNLKKLELLNVSYNPLSSLSLEGAFRQSASLKLSAVHCKLTGIPRISWENKVSVSMNLSYNSVTHLLLPLCLPTDTIITLYGNNVSRITLLEDCQLTSQAPTYFLANNEPVCNCSLQPFLDFVLSADLKLSTKLFPDFNLLRCRHTKFKLKVVNVSCPNDTCPHGCECINRVTNCSNKGKLYPPAKIPKGSTTVLLNDNSIKSLKDTDEGGWNHVTKLNVSNNLLFTLDDWNFPEELLVLDARYNSLRQLPLDLMYRIEEEPNFEVYLSHNEWKCDCGLVNFKEWFMKNWNQIKDFEHISCKMKLGNEVFQEELIMHTSVDSFCIAMRVDSRILIVILPVFLLAVLVFMYYYKSTVLALLYSCNLLPCGYFYDSVEQKDYDALVSANIADREVVVQFVRELEPFYRLCIPDRDWKGSEVRSSSLVADYLKKCRATLIVISKHSLQDVWFQRTVRASYNQRLDDNVHKLIFVIVGDVKMICGKQDIEKIILNQTSLEWRERWFWQKLRYELRLPKRTANIRH